MNSNANNRKRHLAILIGYGLLAVVLTWPTILNFATHLPGDGGDDPAIAWNLWWIKYSLLNQPQNPLASDFMFYPLGINLAFYTLTTLNGLTALPLLLNLGVVAASNLHLWFSLALSGYGVFLLTRTLYPQKSRAEFWGAVFAGLVYAFASSKLFYVSLGQFNIASTHWIPFAVLFFIRMDRQPAQLKWAALCALFLVLQTWTEMTYATFLLVWMALHWLYRLFTDRRLGVIRWPYLKAATVAAILFAVGISPLLGAMLPDMMTEGDFMNVGGGFADAFSADLAGFFIPTMHHPFLGHLIEQTKIGGFDKGQHIYIGYILLILVGIGFFARPRHAETRFWLLSSLIFALLCLGPEIIINGNNTHLGGPFVVFQYLPFFKGNRYPSRYSVMLLLSLAPLAAMGMTWLLRRRAVIVAGLLASAFLFEHLAVPLPQSDMRVPEPYQIIAKDASDFSVLDIPFAWRNGFRITGAYTTGFMFGQFYQTQHQKPMLQGNTSRNPEFKFRYFTDAPILSSLRILETGHDLPPEIWQQDAQFATDVLRFFNLKYIIVRPEEPDYLNNPQATVPYIEAVLPVEKLYQDSDLTLYRVNLPPLPSHVSLLDESHLTPLYFAEGWGIPGETIIAHRKEVRLLVSLNGEAQRVQFELRQRGDATPGTVRLEMNGWRSEPVPLSGEWQSVTIDLPAEAVNAGLNDIRLRFSQVTPLAPGTELTILSAGEEEGNFGHIYLNGVDVSPNRRGYNIAIVAPDGTLLDAANFDTHFDPAASQALAQFIAAAPQDAIIAVAVADEASNNLTEEAVEALQSIGGQVDLRGQFRAAHALIGGKNNLPAQEAFSVYQPVKLTNGAGLIEPQVAAMFRKIEFDAKK